MTALKQSASRRKFLAWLGIFGAGGAVTAYTRFWEPKRLEVGRYEIPLSDRAPVNSFRILHLSDLHASRAVPMGFIAKAVRLGLSLQPDLILLTGDFVTHRFGQFTDYAEVLRTLTATTPTYATLGNHDGGAWAGVRGGFDTTTQVRRLLVESGITLLHNTSAQVQLRDLTLRLVGLGDLWAREFEPAMAFTSGRSDKEITLVLSHNPDTKEELQEREWDVLFCGHTHGGQLRLPLIGAPFAPVRDKRYVDGLHRWQGRWIYITRGIGNLLGVRFNCRPEVSLVTLT